MWWNVVANVNKSCVVSINALITYLLNSGGVLVFTYSSMCSRTRGQKESFFQPRDLNENFFDSISHNETRPRISDTYLRLQYETEKKSPQISGIEARSRFIISILRLRDETEKSLDLVSVFRYDRIGEDRIVWKHTF